MTETGTASIKRATLYGNFLKRHWQASSVEDFCRAYVRFDSGLEAQLIQSNLHAAEKPLWTVVGTHGSVVVENFQGETTVTSIMEDGRKMVSEVSSGDQPRLANILQERLRPSARRAAFTDYARVGEGELFSVSKGVRPPRAKTGWWKLSLIISLSASV